MEHLKRYVAPALLCRLAKYERLHLQRCDDLKDLILFPPLVGTGAHWISHLLKDRTHNLNTFSGYGEPSPCRVVALLALECGAITLLSYTPQVRDRDCSLKAGDVLLLDGVEVRGALVYAGIYSFALGRV